MPEAITEDGGATPADRSADPPSGMLGSGEFASRTGLSIKALRLYAARGLLPPASVNPRTGFRYYGPDQVRQARMVLLLRGLGMSLAEIGQVLAEPESAGAIALVDGYWRRADQEHNARRGLISYVRHLLAEGTAMTDLVYKQRDVPAQRVISLRREVKLDELAGFWAEAHQTLIAHLGHADGCLSGPIFGLFHGYVGDEVVGMVELCVPTGSPIEPAGAIGLRVTPAHQEVYVEVTAAQTATASMVMIHDAIQVWMRGNGLVHIGPSREVYYPNFNPNADPGEHVMDVAFPFRSAE